MKPLEKLLDRLERVTKSGSDFKALCPAHDDRTPSLSISESDGGRVLVHCHAGCKTQDVLNAIGLDMRDIMPESNGIYTSTVSTPSQCRYGVDVSTPYSIDGVDVDAGKYFKTAEEAIDSLCNYLGAYSQNWKYTDTNGEPVAVVLRWDTESSKEIRPVTKCPKGWICRAMNTPRLLYQLPTIEPAEVVYITEGEKSAESLIELGFTATTSQGGCKAAIKTDWTPLAGKTVVILPDNDDAGERYASDVIEQLEQLTTPPRVKVVCLPELPEKGDAFDFVLRFGDDQTACMVAIQEAVDAIECLKLETPLRALGRTPFPTEVLPEPLRAFVFENAKALYCPEVFFVLPMFATTSAAVGNTYSVEVDPNKGWIEPCIVWTLIVGNSGTMKTIAHDKAVAPLRNYQSEAFSIHDEAMLQFERDCEQWEFNNPKPRRNAVTTTIPEPKPIEPTVKRVTVSDTTMEALAGTLSVNPRGLLVDRDEAAGHFQAQNQYKTSGGDDASKWLELFRGNPIIIDRKTSGTIHIKKPFVSFCGTIQPAIFRQTMSNQKRDNGTMARYLIAFPESPPKRWATTGTPSLVTESYEQLINGLLALEQQMDDFGHASPTVLPLSNTARALFGEWYDQHNIEMESQSEHLRATWSKLEAYSPRLALLFCLVKAQVKEGEERSEVDFESMKSAIAVVDWFKGESVRLDALVDSDSELHLILEVVDVIKRNGGSMSSRELQQKSHRFGRKVRNAETWISRVVEHGYGTWETHKNSRGLTTRYVTLRDNTKNKKSTIKEDV
jgi:hypothetical protein